MINIKHGDKTWQVSRASACEKSDWFKNALRNGPFAEGSTGVITLQDDPEFSLAIDTMVRFLPNKEYHLPDREIHKSSAHDHVMVAIIADKYQCPALFSSAQGFLKPYLTPTAISGGISACAWLKLTAVVCEHLNAETAEHQQIRELVLSPLWNTTSKTPISIMRHSSRFQELLRTYADLGADIILRRGDELFHSNKATKIVSECDAGCGFLHVGDWDCTRMCPIEPDPEKRFSGCNCPYCAKTCPRCGSGITQVELKHACDGCTSGTCTKDGDTGFGVFA